jgi:hypothetical protein
VDNDPMPINAFPIVFGERSIIGSSAGNVPVITSANQPLGT